MHLVKPIDDGPHSKKPKSIEPQSMVRPVNKARKDIEAILKDAEDNKRPWPKVPENVKKMNAIELQERVEELGKEEKVLKEELKSLEENMEENGKERVEIRGKLLDINRLRRNLREYIKMYEEANPKESGVGVNEKEAFPDMPDKLAS